ncbi:MAG: nucleoside triphosphate pyrophosphohydrolase [Pseudomonadales bacterium]
MSQYSVDDLLYLMSRLRDPQTGCPWDLKQTPQKIINYSIEEVYELADAIESADIDDIKGELGDVLFQVIFLARLADEEKQFTFNDVVHTLCSKLVTRHPHVFTNGALYPSSGNGEKNEASTASSINEDQVAKNWERIKAGERVKKNRGGLFDDVPLALPALSRAVKLQKRATTIGFDWPNAKGALAKLKEEVLELEELIDQAEQQQDLPANFPQRVEDEMGDVFFSAINVARKMSVNSEQSLRHANKKFVTRVDAVIAKLQQQAPESVDGDELSNTSAVNGKVDSEMLNDLWNAVKREEKPS